MVKRQKSMQKPKLVVVVGPTASGKTALAIKLAKKFHGEIVSADSRQIYRGMDIGTAKPPISYARYSRASTKSSAPLFWKTQKSGAPRYYGGVPHYLINIRNPNQPYNLAQYQRDAIAAIRKIFKKKRLPILAGGTGLYIKAVVDNLDLPKAKPNPALRRNLESGIRNYGIKYFFDKLVRLDPEAAYIVDPKNPRRIIRALEITLTSGVPFSKQRKIKPPLFDTLQIGLNQPQQKLRRQINRRVDEMMENGLVAEVQRLVKKYGAECQAFDAIGYREIIAYLKGEIPLSGAINLIKQNTWHFAKRQVTWFKKDKRIHWVKNGLSPTKLIKSFLR